MEGFMQILLGVAIIMLGYSNTKGNINSLHSYHRKRISEEDRIPFGRLVGLGTIIIGAALVIAGILSFMQATEVIKESIIGVGLVVGLGISLYAMFKYNKGIF